jgi:hypothetical protein
MSFPCVKRVSFAQPESTETRVLVSLFIKHRVVTLKHTTMQLAVHEPYGPCRKRHILECATLYFTYESYTFVWICVLLSDRYIFNVRIYVLFSYFFLYFFNSVLFNSSSLLPRKYKIFYLSTDRDWY